MRSFEARRAELDRRNAQVLGITVDNVPANDAWARTLGGLGFPILSDFFPHGHVALQYGVLRGSGVSERAIFVIDGAGVVRFAHVYDFDVLPLLEPILAELDGIQGSHAPSP